MLVEQYRSLIYITSEIFSKGMAVLMLPLLSLVMTPVVYGQAGLIIPIIQLLQGAAICGLSVSQLRSYADASHKKEEVNLNLLFFFVCWVVVALLAGGVLDLYNIKWCETSILLIICITLMQSMNLFNLQLCQSERRAIGFLLFDNFPKFVLIISGVFLWVSRDGLVLEDLYWAYGISGICISLVTVYHFHKKIRGRVRWDLIGTFAVIGFPLAINSFFAFLMQLSGKFVIMNAGEIEGLAVYTFCISMANAVFFVIAVYNRIFIPDLFDNLAQRGGLANFLSQNLHHGTIVFGSALVCLNGFMIIALRFHADDTYNGYAVLATLTLLPNVAHMAYNSGLNILSYDKRSFVALGISIVFGCLSLLGSWISFNYGGVYGVAVAQALIGIAMSFVFLLLGLRYGDIDISVLRLFRTVLIVIGLLCGLVVIEYLFDIYIYITGLVSVLSAAFCFIYLKRHRFLLILS